MLRMCHKEEPQREEVSQQGRSHTIALRWQSHSVPDLYSTPTPHQLTSFPREEPACIAPSSPSKNASQGWLESSGTNST